MAEQNGVKVVFIKKKAKGHGHHGGAWKVAYADFVTAMMALFIVLWLLTQSDQVSKEKIAEYFRTGTLPGGALMIGKPGGSMPPTPVNLFPDGPGQAMAAESRELAELAKTVKKVVGRASSKSKTPTLGKHVRVRMVSEGALIELVEGGDNFLFNVASAELKPGAIQILEELAPTLSALSNKLEIHGHTDARPFPPGSKASNWSLSFERGDQARRVLEGKGVEKGKIQSVLAHADTALYNPDDPLAPENRRLSILVVRPSAERARAGLAGEGQGSAKALQEQAEQDDKATDEEEAKPKRRSFDDEEEEPKPKRRSFDDEEDVPSTKRRSFEDDEDVPKPKRSLDDDDDFPKRRTGAQTSGEPAAAEDVKAIPAKGVSEKTLQEAIEIRAGKPAK